MTQEKLEQLKATATEVRRGILTEVHAAKSGHPGGSLSVADAPNNSSFTPAVIAARLAR